MNGRWAYFKLQYPLVRRLLAGANRARDIFEHLIADARRQLHQRLVKVEDDGFEVRHESGG